MLLAPRSHVVLPAGPAPRLPALHRVPFSPCWQGYSAASTGAFVADQVEAPVPIRHTHPGGWLRCPAHLCKQPVAHPAQKLVIVHFDSARRGSGQVRGYTHTRTGGQDSYGKLSVPNDLLSCASSRHIKSVNQAAKQYASCAIIPYFILFYETILPHYGLLQENCYLYACPQTLEAAIIDPGDEAERILARIQELKLIPKYIINTHVHIDHIGAIDAVSAV